MKITDNPTQLENKLEPCPFCGGPAEKRLTDGPKRGFIGCFTCVIGLPFNAPYGDKEIAAWNSRASRPPMCAVHTALDRDDTLVLEVGNDCIACSLHERTQLLNLLEPFAAEDGSQDSLTVLRNVIASAAPSPSSPVPAEPKSLLRDPVKVDVSTQRTVEPPPLIVTRDGVPCADQSAALEEFKERCPAATPTPVSLAAREAAEAAAREVIDAVWGEAKKLAESFVKANIRNYNDHKGVASLEIMYEAKRDTAQQIFNQMHNFNEARWKRADDIVEIILKHCSPVPAAGGDEDQCAWTLDDSNDGDIWETGCGEAFQFNDGGPAENKFVFCYKCGKRINAAKYSDFDDQINGASSTPNG